ncbi:MAG: DNA alkylation repair protein [Sideroxydans sp.]|jgi:3-methyladenine DNA glycosylase AlkD
MSRLATIRAELRALAAPDTATVLQRFFKTGPGEYGEGDVFLGIKVPPLRTLAKQHRDTGLTTIAALLDSRYHEERLFALLLLIQLFQAADTAGQQAAFDLYLGKTQRINNWDLVDVSAPHIVGGFLEQRPRNVLDTLARSPLLWERRIAIVATLHFIRRNDCADTLRLARILLHDKHDLMHKAVGWMLREVGKRDMAALEAFVRTHQHSMPRTMLRSAIERFNPLLRKRYLHGKSGLA